MSDTDNAQENTLPAIYHQGPVGTISGFDQPDSSLGEVNISLQQVYAKIRELQESLDSNYSPALLRDLLLKHISDYNNPHHDTFASLGFDISKDLVGSILPGTVPTQAPSYALDPLSLLPNTSLPTSLGVTQYINDITPVITKGSDNGANDTELLWLDEQRNPVSLDDFNNKQTPYGYSLIPTTITGLGQPGLLCQQPLTLFEAVDPSTLRLDANTKLTQYKWDIDQTTLKTGDKLLPTLSVPVNTGATTATETTFLWYGLVNMVLGNKPNAYVIFTAPDGSKLVVQYTNNNGNTANTVKVVYKSGYIEPVFQTEYCIGGVRFNAQNNATLTINWTVTGTKDWSNYQESDISFGNNDVQFPLPSVYLMKFILGNPNFLLGSMRDTVNVTPLGLMIASPSGNNITTSSVTWQLPVLSTINNIGIFSMGILVDNLVDSNSSGITIFDSDTLKINLSMFDDGTNQTTQWDIDLTDGHTNTTLSVGGRGEYLQCIALSADGTSLRVRVTGSSGVMQIPSSIKLNSLPNSKLGNFNGALMNIETYGIPDDGYTLDFLVGDNGK